MRKLMDWMMALACEIGLVDVTKQRGEVLE